LPLLGATLAKGEPRKRFGRMGWPQWSPLHATSAQRGALIRATCFAMRKRGFIAGESGYNVLHCRIGLSPPRRSTR
jgi:hypothetical protein